jgi:hypothetical protein
MTAIRPTTSPRSIFCAALTLCAPLVAGCSDDSSPTGAGGGGTTGTELVFEVDADLTQSAAFYDQPYPSDARLTERGTPNLNGFPHDEAYTLVRQLRDAAMDHPAFPVVPVAYFRFTGALAPRDAERTIAADPRSFVLLVDVDESSDERGRLFPTVASTPEVDAFVPEHLLAVAGRPGVVLHPKRTYAFVVLRSLQDDKGRLLDVAPAIADLLAGDAPRGNNGAALQKLYAPLVSTLPLAGIDPEDVAAATVFTTGDVVRDLFDITTGLVAKHAVTITGLEVDPDDGAAHDRYCELVGRVSYPQFQRGTPPFNEEGLFELGGDGLPQKQGEEEAPLTITLPNGEMPANGFPLVLYFHGSGGTSTAIADRGTWFVTDDPSICPDNKLDEWEGQQGCNTKGEGPAHVLAPFGFAMAGSALPVNPERLPGAAETEYLNFNNLPSGRDLFRQGAIEQRLLLEALSSIEIDPSVVASCAGVTLPAGATAFRFDMESVFAQGQSMGGQYTNLVSAVEPRIKGAVPTGAGGYWSHFIMHTTLIPNLPTTVGTLLLGTRAEIDFLHPGLQVFQTVWEAVDPMVYMPRLAQRPLPGHPARSIYEPAGKGDSYFSTVTYDAMALAYGHEQAGDEVWPTMQEALALDGLDGILDYPIEGNVKSADGTRYTGVVVQYEGDGIYDPHALYSQRDEVKYQYGCFLSTLLRNGAATVPAPAPLGTPCPR